MEMKNRAAARKRREAVLYRPLSKDYLHWDTRRSDDVIVFSHERLIDLPFCKANYQTRLFIGLT